jgi:hypothetical protein
MNIKAFIAALLTVFVIFPLALFLFGLLMHYLWPVATLIVLGSVVFVVYKLFCFHYEQ